MIPGCRTCEGGFHEYCENNRECACCYHCPDCEMQTRVGEMHLEACSFQALIDVKLSEVLPQWVREREQA